MRNPHRAELSRSLLAAGMSFWQVRRAVSELDDHYQDLADEARNAGLSWHEAHCEAGQRLGSCDLIADGYRQQGGRDLHGRSELMVAGIVLALEWADDAVVDSSQCLIRWVFALTAGALGTVLFLLGLHGVLFG